METRREKYSKYREEIRLTPDTAFPTSKHVSREIGAEDTMVLRSVNTSSRAISYGSILEPLEPSKKQEEDSLSPYEKYLARRRRSAITKIVLFAVVVAALAIWFLIMQMGR